MSLRKIYIALLFIVAVSLATAQVPFSLLIKPSTTVTNVPALHSGVYVSYNNNWLFIGGRKNGLHGFLPPFAFPISGVPDSIYVLDPALNKKWSAPVDVLSDNIREAITSSNMEFYLSDSMLYMIGGYGWKDSISNFVTFPTLTAVNVKRLMDAVMQGASIASYFRQIIDQRFAVCGTHLKKIDSTYYLIFGHRFDGRYDRSSTSGFHVQKYTNEIRKFKIVDSGTNLSITSYVADKDTVNFHRRDLNIMPQYYFNGEKALTAFSGVFQYNKVLPFLNCVNISKTGTAVDATFNQYLSQYHSAVATTYDSVPGKQYNIFFGGISEFYIDTITHLQMQDTLVPFVNTISIVVRDKNNNYSEYNASITMPALLGTNAYFFPVNGCPVFFDGIIDYSKLSGNQLIGFIVGGIATPEKNISLTDPVYSSANAIVYEVWLDKSGAGIKNVSVSDHSLLDLEVFPNPAVDNITVSFFSEKQQSLKIDIFNMEGQLMKEVFVGPVSKEQCTYSADTKTLPAGNYFINVRNNSIRRAVKFSKK